MDKRHTEYYCRGCEGIFITPATCNPVYCCPYCGDTEKLDITALQSAACEIEEVEDDYDIAPERKEMLLLERSVDELGVSGICNAAIRSMSYLIGKLVEINAVLKSPLCTGREYSGKLAELNNAKARVAISLNQLDVLFGDSSEEECRELEALERALDAIEEASAQEAPQKAKAAVPPEDTTT